LGRIAAPFVREETPEPEIVVEPELEIASSEIPL
jgi:hypothetical protein